MNSEKQHTGQEKSFTLTRHFGERLKQARIKLGLDVRQASEIINIEKNSYYKYEDGSRFPKPEILLSIMDKFKLSIDYLLSGQGEIFIETIKKAGENDKLKNMNRLFPGLDPEALSLVEDLQVPIMKHALMMHYLVEKNKYKDFINDYFEKKAKKFPEVEDTA